MLLCNFSKVTQLESDSVRIQTQDCLTGKLNENTYKHALSPQAPAMTTGTRESKLLLPLSCDMASYTYRFLL